MKSCLRMGVALLAMSAMPLIVTPARAEAAAAAGAVEAHERFTVERVGTQGPDVILIPGLATPRDVFRPLAERLKGKARLHLVELRGFAAGDAGPNAQGGAIAGTVEGLAAYIRAQGLEHALVIGHSLGGLAALELAERHPEGIDRVMIVEALPYAGIMVGGPSATVEAIEPRAKAMRDGMLAAAAAGRTMPAATNLALSAAGKAKITQWAGAVDLRAVAHAVYEDLTTDARPGLAALRVPLTIIYAWDGQRLTRAQADQLYRGVYAPARGTTFVPVGQSGHFVMLDQPEAFDRAVDAFLGVD